MHSVLRKTMLWHNMPQPESRSVITFKELKSKLLTIIIQQIDYPTIQ